MQKRTCISVIQVLVFIITWKHHQTLPGFIHCTKNRTLLMLMHITITSPLIRSQSNIQITSSAALALRNPKDVCVLARKDHLSIDLPAAHDHVRSIMTFDTANSVHVDRFVKNHVKTYLGDLPPAHSSSRSDTAPPHYFATMRDGLLASSWTPAALNTK